jgi:hypothetical protein
MTYNMTCLYDAANWGGIATCANTATEGNMFGGLTVGLFFVFLLALRKGGGWGVEESVLASGFSLFVLSGVLAYGGFVNIMYPLGYLIITAFMGLYVWASRG